MTKWLDKKESEYWAFKLFKWKQDNPELNLEEEVIKNIMAKNDAEAKKNNCLYLQTIQNPIPNSVIEIMTEIMDSFKKSGETKYAKYRACEDYIVKTNWFFELDPDKKFKIRYDFYKYIILGIHEAYCRTNDNISSIEKIYTLDVGSTAETNNNLIHTSDALNIKEKKVDPNTKSIMYKRMYFPLAILITMATSIIAGFYFKTPNLRLINLLFQQRTKWKRDDVEYLSRLENGLFGLKDFDYNWMAMILTLIGLTSLLIMLKRQLK